MTTLTEQVEVKSEGNTISRVIWRRFKTQMTGLVERTLAMEENRGLAKLGTHLPVGTIVTIPVDTPRSEETRTATRLW